ncbi:hypothetical protein K413DRAFT_0399 [Clostridium sp. ASBs410]|nr:hypothetical protein K413DRAFT_0399 [Clostridium sp. ASBs410]
MQLEKGTVFESLNVLLDDIIFVMLHWYRQIKYYFRNVLHYQRIGTNERSTYGISKK